MIAFVLLLMMILPHKLFGKIIPIIDENYENCASPDEDYKGFDFDDYDLIALNDYDVFLNGTVKILKPVVSQIPAHITAERFERGKWIVTYLDTKRPDICASLKNPMEVWYDKFKSKKGCPLSAGVRKNKSFIFLMKNFGNLGRMEV